MNDNLIVFEFQTVPNTDLISSQFSVEKELLPHLLDFENEVEFGGKFEGLGKVREKICSNHNFLKLPYHRIASASFIIKRENELHLVSLGGHNADENETPNSIEKQIIEFLISAIDGMAPQLVTWGGSGFHLPLIGLKLVQHLIPSHLFWSDGSTNSDFKYNNYTNRYHKRHMDLCDVLSQFNGMAMTSLQSLSRLCGFYGDKSEIQSDSYLSELYNDGNFSKIKNIGEIKVLSVYMSYIRFLLIKNILDKTNYNSGMKQIVELVLESKKENPLLDQFSSDFLNTFLGEGNE